MSYRFDKLTIKAQEALAQSQSLAGEAGNPQVDPLHLLAALLDESDGVVRPILDKIGVNRSQLQDMVRSELERFPKVSGGAPPQASPQLRSLHPWATIPEKISPYCVFR